MVKNGTYPTIDSILLVLELISNANPMQELEDEVLLLTQDANNRRDYEACMSNHGPSLSSHFVNPVHGSLLRLTTSACQLGLVRVVRMLLEDPRAAFEFGYCWIGVAAYAGHTQVVDLLLRDMRSCVLKNESTVLWCAMKGGSASCVERLLQDKRILNNVKKELHKCTVGALARGYTDVARILMSHVPKRGALVYSSCRYNNLEILHDLMNDSSIEGKSLFSKGLVVAVKCGHIRIIEALLKDGRADPSEGRHHALKLSRVKELEIMSM